MPSAPTRTSARWGSSSSAERATSAPRCVLLGSSGLRSGGPPLPRHTPRQQQGLSPCTCSAHGGAWLQDQPHQTTQILDFSTRVIPGARQEQPARVADSALWVCLGPLPEDAAPHPALSLWLHGNGPGHVRNLSTDPAPSQQLESVGVGPRPQDQWWKQVTAGH